MKIINRSRSEQTFNGVTIAAGASYTSDPLDHDHGGRKGGSKPATEAPEIVQRLRDEYTELTGKKPHHLWKAERIQAEIDKALES